MFILIIQLVLLCPNHKEAKKEFFFPQEQYFAAKDAYYEWKEKIGTKQLTNDSEVCTLTEVKSGSRKVKNK